LIKTVNSSRFLLVLTCVSLFLLFASCVDSVDAVSVRYDFNKASYVPGENGTLTLTFNPTPEDIVITNVKLEISVTLAT